jgi:hypothetical protein
MNLTDYEMMLEHNAKILTKCLANRSLDISNIIFYEGCRAKELSFDKLASKMYDILACCAIGAIPSIESTGADGYIWLIGKKSIVPVETKLCSIENKNIFIGPRGGLYWSSDPTNYYNKASIRSHFSGKFDSDMSHETLKTKSRWTSLICFDRDTNSVIDAWIIGPRVIFNELVQRRQNSTLTLKLSCFMNKGSQLDPAVPFEGYFNWEERQAKLAKSEGRVVQW